MSKLKTFSTVKNIVVYCLTGDSIKSHFEILFLARAFFAPLPIFYVVLRGLHF